jgi:hypothetical protein
LKMCTSYFLPGNRRICRQSIAMVGGVLPLRASVGCGALLVATLAAGPAWAQSLVLKCEERGESATAPMSMVYEGAASGTLKVTGSFGEMTLPARREDREGITGIRAFGNATVLMPDPSALDACIAARRAGGTAPDPDVDALSVFACSEKLPNGPTPVAVTATVEIALIEPPVAQVFLRRSYVEKSGVTGEIITLESVPPPSCTQAAAQ